MRLPKVHGEFFLPKKKEKAFQDFEGSTNECN
jgi:hypothetical protein